MKKLVVALIGLLALIYLINPMAGIFELIPDNVPFIGNLDEATATALLLACLKYFGVDVIDIVGRNKKESHQKVR